VGKCLLVLEAGTQRILGHELCRCKAFAKETTPVLVRQERAGWRTFRDKNTEDHAIIADAGFASHADFSELIAENKHFIIAVPKSWKIVAQFRAMQTSDSIVTIAMPQDSSRSLTLRIFTIRDSDGNSHYIATSLREPFTLSDCRRLYKTRWAIETWFRYAKQFLALRTLRSTTLNGIRLEILAILLVMQAVAAIRAAIALHTNNITSLLCTLQNGFRKAKFRTALRAAWRIIGDTLANREDDDPPPEFTKLFTTTIRYKSGRKFKRISKDPSSLFIPRRPSQAQRKAMKKKKLTD
jgi:Transposase DDE domain